MVEVGNGSGGGVCFQCYCSLRLWAVVDVVGVNTMAVYGDDGGVNGWLLWLAYDGCSGGCRQC